MNYLFYTAEELALDGSFQNYCLERNRDDIGFWEKWLEVHPDRALVVQQARQMVLLLSAQNEAQLREDRALFQSIIPKYKGDAGSNRRLYRSSVRPLRQNLFRAAAVFIALGVAVAVLVLNSRTAIDESYTALEASRPGERKHFYLSDGTKVTLNAGSAIDISEQFNTVTREIVLNGEAFFEVAHDENKPFIIHTARMDIRVLGTTFNVKAYPGDEIAETSLLEGSVEITMKGNEKTKVVLKPNEKLVLPAPDSHKEDAIAEEPEKREREEYPFVVTQVTYNKKDSIVAEVSWTESRLVFNDQSFEELARALERWYDLSIEFADEEIKDFRFTATFEQKTIAQVLGALQLSRPFKYTMDGKKIIIDK